MYILHSLLNFHIQDVLDSNSKEEETTFANIFLKIVLQFFTLCLHRSCENLNKNIMIDSMNAVSYDRDSQYLTVEIPTQILILSQALAIFQGKQSSEWLGVLKQLEVFERLEPVTPSSLKIMKTI